MLSTMLNLCFQFIKTGLFSVGGGLATLPFLYEISARYGWFSATDIADMIAVSESTPGAIGINMATYAGYLTGGVPGAVLATISLALPSIVIILLIARFLKRFKDNPAVKNTFYGLRPASVAMISAAGINVALIALVSIDQLKQTGSILSFFHWKAVILAVLLFAGMKKLRWHPVAFIALSAAAGVIFRF